MHRKRTPRSASLMAAALALFALAAVGVAPQAGAAPQTIPQSFIATGQEQSFQVPSGVYEVQVQAVGAPGAAGLGDEDALPAAGGLGAEVSGTVDVIPGETLYVEVGMPGGAAKASGSAPGGWNGGGGSGTGGGGGGGASDVRTCSMAQLNCSGRGTLESRVIVAAGGGGGGSVEGLSAGGPGGAGGAKASGEGESGESGKGAAPGAGGGGGTALAGGLGGTGPVAGKSGIEGEGGEGAKAPDGGGGGGGGFFGGGGGGGAEATGGGGGGGAGSSLGPVGATIAKASTPFPIVTISYTVRPPEASTGWAGNVSTSSATLGGLILPEGQSTTYFFEYGTSTAYDQTTPVEGAGAEEAPELVQSTVQGLSPATTYHFRIVAINAQGTTYGLDESFTTQSALSGPPGPAGPQGPAGLTGAQGSPGQVELVTCTTTTTKRGHGKRAHKVRVTHCTTRLTSSPVKFTVQGKAKAALARHGHIYARGSLRSGRLVLHSHHRIGQGSYTLILKRGGHSIRQQITLD